MQEFSDKTNISIGQSNQFGSCFVPTEIDDKLLNNNYVYKKAIGKFGNNYQVIKAIEELSELQKELCKTFIENKSNKEKRIASISEEIADVEIMLEQLKIIFDCHAIIETVKKQKIERLKGLVENG